MDLREAESERVGVGLKVGEVDRALRRTMRNPTRLRRHLPASRSGIAIQCERSLQSHPHFITPGGASALVHKFSRLQAA